MSRRRAARRPDRPPLLLDEMISPAVAEALRAKGVDALALMEADRRLRSRPDEEILRYARASGRALVTFDLSSVPRILVAMSRSGEPHAGVVLVSTKTIRTDEIGVLSTALERLALDAAGASLEGKVIYLRRPE